MHRRVALRSVVLATGLATASLLAGIAQTRPADMQWRGKAGDQMIQVPAGDKPTVMLFVRADQPQSQEILQQAAQLLPAGEAHAIVVYSGPLAAMQAQQSKSPFPAVADTDYALSGRMGVHAWPTTIMLNAKGDTVSHIAGVTKGFGAEFAASLDLLAGKIDQAAFNARLNDRHVIADNPAQAASRHLQMAGQMLRRDRLEDAAGEVAAGLKLQPDNAALKLLQVRVLVLQGNADEANKVLQTIAAGSAPAPQIALARGRVLAAQGQLDHAIEALEQAIRLNPDPAEAQYELGLVYQRKGEYQRAAEALRAAYESRE